MSKVMSQSGDAASAVLTPAIQRAIGHEAAAYRLAIFGILHGSDAQVRILPPAQTTSMNRGRRHSSIHCVWVW